MNSPRVLVVGSANTDLVVAVAEIPNPGQTVLGGDVRVAPGGKGANQAVAAARLGAQVTFVARLGDDAYGHQSRLGFVAEGIDARFVFETPGVPSGVALIAVAASGENAIVVAPGANSRLSESDVLSANLAFDEADIVLISLEIPAEAVFAALDQAHRLGKPVILNPAPARPIPAEYLAKVTILTPNETEADRYGGVDELRRSGVKTIVTTLGARGSVIVTDAPPQFVPAIPVRAVDTVAAGDCFTAALGVKMAEGATLSDAVRFATAAAALKVTRPGAQPGLPTRAEVDSFTATQSLGDTAS